MTVPRAVVMVGALRLRKEPSLEAPVLARLERGGKVVVVGHGMPPHHEWTQVQHETKLGWVASKHLRLPDDPLGALVTRENYPWMPVALAEVGVKETAGGEATARITEYLRTTSLGAQSAASDETPWCSAFVNWCVERGGYAGTDSAWARSWLDWGNTIKYPRRGCVVILERGDGGHVGFFVSLYEQHLFLLGGNQGNEVSAARYPLSRVLGYRGFP